MNHEFNRAPPAFQLFASDLIADKRYRKATPAQRGLLLTLWCECWVNSTIPADPDELAAFIGWKIEDFKLAATNDIFSFFNFLLKSAEFSPVFARPRHAARGRRSSSR
jgi:hypothetical protein